MLNEILYEEDHTKHLNDYFGNLIPNEPTVYEYYKGIFAPDVTWSDVLFLTIEEI